MEGALKALDTLTAGMEKEMTSWAGSICPPLVTEELISSSNLLLQGGRERRTVIVTGIGGSYLGAKSAIDALSHSSGFIWVQMYLR